MPRHPRVRSALAEWRSRYPESEGWEEHRPSPTRVVRWRKVEEHWLIAPDGVEVVVLDLATDRHRPADTIPVYEGGVQVGSFAEMNPTRSESPNALDSGVARCRWSAPRPRRPRAAGRPRARAPGGDDPDPPHPCSPSWRRDADDVSHGHSRSGDASNQPRLGPEPVTAGEPKDRKALPDDWESLSPLQRIQRVVIAEASLAEMEAVARFVAARWDRLERRSA